MQVVEHEHHRLGGREPLQQVVHRSVGAIALVLKGDLAGIGELGHRRKHPPKLGAHTVVE